MPNVEPGFTPLECAVLAAICAMHPAECLALQAQFATATVRSRENTGAGFFTNFDVVRSAAPAILGRRLRDGPQARVKGLMHGMGFILWFDDGYARQLEGYCYGPESTLNIELEKVGFEITKD